jgi:DNA modification methylase
MTAYPEGTDRQIAGPIETNNPKVEMLAISLLTPDPRNARRHPDKQIAQLAANIRHFGFPIPIVADQHGVIVAGHGRWEAARKLGLSEVPVIRRHFLNPAERRAFALADNRLAELSSWDPEILSGELEVLFEGGFDISTIGFSTADLDFAIVDDKDGETKRGATDRIDLPDPDEQAVSRVGDLWLSGPHRLLCGDARDVGCWEQLLGEDRASLVFSDPPFNVKINGHVSGTGRAREFVMGAGELSPPQFTTFLRAGFRNCVRFSIDGSIHYHCMDWRHAREILDAADGIYDQFKQLVVWAKTNASMGTFYRSRHELVFVFKAGRGRHINNFGLGDTGRYRTNVVEYAGANTFRKGRAEDLEAHSTVKPTAMVADFILDCSNRGDLVVDPFIGSGTTLIAAHRTKRRGAGIELDPVYVDTALRRLAKIVGLSPVLAGDGRTFEEIAAARNVTREA